MVVLVLRARSCFFGLLAEILELLADLLESPIELLDVARGRDVERAEDAIDALLDFLAGVLAQAVESLVDRRLLELSLDLPEERADTLGGFLFARLGRVGLVGDVVDVAVGEFRITRMRGRRIEYAVFRPRPGPEKNPS